MKKILLVLMVLLLIVSPAFALFSESFKILTKEEIQKLTDEVLSEAYIDARIEEKASGEFYRSAGFSSAKEYNLYKKLLRYLFELRREMGVRKEINSEAIDKYME